MEGSTSPSISASGTRIAFHSTAGGLGRPEQEYHVYVATLGEGAVPISVFPSWNNQYPSISGDGQLVAFQSDSQLIPQDTNGSSDIYVFDTQSSTFARASSRPSGDNEVGRLDSLRPEIASSGAAVAFHSSATNLAPGDTNNNWDVYVSRSFEAPPQTNSQIKNYVALGDSFSAGEGVDPYDAGTDTDENRCHRSAGAYARFIVDPSDKIPLHGKAQVDPTFSWRFVACSGATTENVKSATNGGSPQFNEPGTQLDQGAAGSDTDLITITIGGNDAEYADVMQECFFHACTSPGFEKDGVPFTEWVTAKVDAVPLRSTYADIRGHAPNALILTLGYPKLLPPDIPVTCPTLVPYQEEEDFLNSMGDRMNLRIAQGANAEGVPYVSVDQAFEGHWVCGDKGEWINGPSVTGDWGWPPLTARSEVFHPNLFGHQGYAQVVNEFLQGTWGDGSSAASASNSGQRVRQYPSRVRLEGPLGSIDPLEITTTRANSCIREVAGSLRIRGSDFAPNSDLKITATIPDEIPIELDAAAADERGVVTRWIDIPGVLEGELVGFEMRGIDRDGGERWLITPVRVRSDDDACGVSAGSVRI